MSRLTAWPDEAERLTTAEDLLVLGWRFFLEQGLTPRFVASLIEQAVSFDPRLGVAMDECRHPGCPVLVDERERDANGSLYCSDAHRDAADEHEEERRQAAIIRALGDELRWLR